MRKDEVRYRSSPNIVAYWKGEQLIFQNFATGARVAGNALTIGLLDYFRTWHPISALLKTSDFRPAAIRAAVADLVNATLLHQSDQPQSATEQAMESWSSWNPAAGFLHFSTKDLKYESNAKIRRILAARAKVSPPPPPLKSLPQKSAVKLMDVAQRSQFARVLLGRRTWRRFGTKPVTKRQISSLLDLTFRAKAWMDLGVTGPAMLRTSPSAGAMNPIEAYVVARHVSGIRAGIYHYDPSGHQLRLLKRGATRGAIRKYLPSQPWYGDSAALVLMTAVFARNQWKYAFPHAYRTILLEAGHFCQTLCLVATSLGLAPFCTATLADSLIEKDLGNDGVTESVVYAFGVGTRPRGTSWAPFPHPEPDPAIVPSPEAEHEA